jgi:drug/metabolite transporter (DMT)-like permease
VSYAFAGVYGRRFRTMGVEPLVTATGQVTASSIILVPLALLVERPWQGGWPGGATIGAMLGLALVSTAFAYLLYFRILARAGATNVILVTFLIPVSAILLGATFLGERLALRGHGPDRCGACPDRRAPRAGLAPHAPQGIERKPLKTIWLPLPTASSGSG